MSRTLGLVAIVAVADDGENQIIAALKDGPAIITDMVEKMYVGVDRRLYPAASMSVLAHIIRMVGDGRVSCADSPPSLHSTYKLP